MDMLPLDDSPELRQPDKRIFDLRRPGPAARDPPGRRRRRWTLPPTRRSRRRSRTILIASFVWSESVSRSWTRTRIHAS